jgi:hypothetical protein
VFWLLHFASLYDKAFSWISYRCPVDLYLAESRWIAQCLQREIGVRAVVINSGVNPNHFRPVEIPKTYDVLCYGDREREWKGTRDIEAACRLLGLTPATYDGKGIPQERMAEEYCRARVFVHGSWYEGFGLPGLEALACGVPLVTTDSGGPRDYAFHEETALVVPPREPRAMADAIRRLHGDEALCEKLARQGRELVTRCFRWPDKACEVVRVLERALAAPDETTPREPAAATPRARPARIATIATSDAHTAGAGSRWNAELERRDEDLVVIAPGADGTAPSRGALEALDRGDGTALVVDGMGGVLAPWPCFSRAPAAARYVGDRDALVRAGGFGEGLHAYAGTEDFLFWNLWWHGYQVVGPPQKSFAPPSQQDLLRTFAARGAALARFLYEVPEGPSRWGRPYGVEARWANGPRSVPELAFPAALEPHPERVERELDLQQRQRRALPDALTSLWREVTPAVAKLVREERSRRIARDELMRETREERQRQADQLTRLQQEYSPGQAAWSEIASRRELARSLLQERAGQTRGRIERAMNVAVILAGVLVGLAWRGGTSLVLHSRAASALLIALAFGTAFHVLWRVGQVLASERRRRCDEAEDA